MYILACVNHTLMISPHFRTLQMIIWPSLCIVQLQSLMMDQWDPKHLGVLSVQTLWCMCLVVLICNKHNTFLNYEILWFLLFPQYDEIGGSFSTHWNEKWVHYLVGKAEGKRESVRMRNLGNVGVDWRLIFERTFNKWVRCRLDSAGVGWCRNLPAR